jgi:hypothetical protein
LVFLYILYRWIVNIKFLFFSRKVYRNNQSCSLIYVQVLVQVQIYDHVHVCIHVFMFMFKSMHFIMLILIFLLLFVFLFMFLFMSVFMLRCTNKISHHVTSTFKISHTQCPTFITSHHLLYHSTKCPKALNIHPVKNLIFMLPSVSLHTMKL